MGTFHRQLLRYVCDWSRTCQRPEEALISASVRDFPAAGIGAHTAVRAGNRNSGDHLAGRVANRRGNRTHALIAFIDRLGPAALADGGELGRSELGVAKTLMQAFGILPSQQNLGCRTGFRPERNLAGRPRAPRLRCRRADRPDGGRSARIRRCGRAGSAESARRRSTGGPRRLRPQVPRIAIRARNDRAGRAKRNGDVPARSQDDARSDEPDRSRKPAVRVWLGRIQERRES